jgi:hypothetical protein
MRQHQGELSTHKTTYVHRPRTATGMPRKYDWDDVVTLAQLTNPLSEQKRSWAPLKCAFVRYADNAKPIRLNRNVV